MEYACSDNEEDATIAKRIDEIIRNDNASNDGHHDNNKESSNSRDCIWNQKYQELVVYTQEFGNANVPKHFLANTPVGNLVSKHMYGYKLLKEKKKSSMTKERIQSLEAIGF